MDMIFPPPTSQRKLGQLEAAPCGVPPLQPAPADNNNNLVMEKADGLKSRPVPLGVAPTREQEIISL